MTQTRLLKKTAFPKGHTRATWQTRNMSREFLDHAARIAGLRRAGDFRGATVESVVLDCLRIGLPSLEHDVKVKLTEKEPRR